VREGALKIFRPEERDRLRSELLDHAAADGRIGGAAITGSAAEGSEDRWSDIDLAFAVRSGPDLLEVVDDWTKRMYDRYHALHHLDMSFGPWLYRVFLLPGTLQVDLAFVPAAEFRALGPSFRLVFGESNEPRHAPPPQGESLIGMAWLYALHARTSIARGRLWQAEYMIAGVRNHALALACVRLGLPAVHARGADLLPSEITAQFERSLVKRLDLAELKRAFGVALLALMNEIQASDERLAEKQTPAITMLRESS